MSNDPAEFAQDGGAPAVLLLHGFTSTPWETRPVAAALARAGFATRSPVLPGHGSSPDALAKATWEQWLQCARRELDALIAEHKYVVIAGFSLGALLAITAGTSRQHSGVIAVIALGAATGLSPLSTKVLAVAERLAGWMPDVRLKKYRGSDVRDPLAKRLNPAYRVQPLRAARELLKGQRAALASVQELSVPLLVMHGRHDATVPMSKALQLVDHARRAPIELRILPQSAHLLGVDVERAQVCDAIVSFVQRVKHERGIDGDQEPARR
jgi:carboxylesterase